MVTNTYDNPQQPSFSSEAFLPDQLIAGELKLVTETVTILAGANLTRGAVLGKITQGSASTTAGAGNTGNGTITAIVTGSKSQVGRYTVRFLTAGTYIVIDPDGNQLASGTGSGAYGSGVNPELAFTFTPGGTGMAAGDLIFIDVAAGTGKYKLAAAAAGDGSDDPVAILADDAAAASADKRAGIYLTGEFNSRALNVGVGHTVASVTPALRALGIFVKGTVSAADPI